MSTLLADAKRLAGIPENEDIMGQSWETLSRVKRIYDLLQLETERKVIDNAPRSSVPVDVATPGTAHPLPKFRSVDQMTQELHGTAQDENIAWKYYDLAREHEQRIRLLADALQRVIDEANLYPEPDELRTAFRSAGLLDEHGKPTWK